MLPLLTAVLLSIAPAALAQQTIWGQCGGNGWTGPTTCVSGASCVFSNDWYSQCLPSPGSSQAPPTSVPVTSTSVSSSATPSTTPVSPGTANYWFSFGDSYTQTGFDPAGSLPSDSNPLGNPPYPGWTATGGPNWVGLGTTVYNKSHIYTYNYAYGGATIDANLVQPYTPTVLSLTDQVNQFLTTAANKPPSTPWTTSNSLFSVFIGINDIGNSWYQSGDRAAFSDTLLNAEFALVEQLVSARMCRWILTPIPHTSGARNFLFVNVPPIDRSPLMLQQSPESQAGEKAVIEGFNAKLAAKVAAFKTSHSGVQTYLWDSSATFTRILNSPTTYGFIDATSYGSGAGIFWGNDYHPSSAAHDFFAQDVADVLEGTIW